MCSSMRIQFTNPCGYNVFTRADTIYSSMRIQCAHPCGHNVLIHADTMCSSKHIQCDHPFGYNVFNFFLPVYFYKQWEHLNMTEFWSLLSYPLPMHGVFSGDSWVSLTSAILLCSKTDALAEGLLSLAHTLLRFLEAPAVVATAFAPAALQSQHLLSNCTRCCCRCSSCWSHSCCWWIWCSSSCQCNISCWWLLCDSLYRSIF